jgi:phosphatidate cytidylyltransferase
MLLLLILLLVLLLFVVEIFRKQENPFTNIAYSVAGIIWIAVPFSLIGCIPSMLPEGKYFLLSVFIFVWLYDTLAYCIGSLIGKHRLLERISPKKSWEGTIGATILTIAVAFLMPEIFTTLPLTVIQWIFLAFIVTVAATIGDLVESLFKRQLIVKDSGSILPGHGGILDRFDSILFVIPLVSLYLIFIV